MKVRVRRAVDGIVANPLLGKKLKGPLAAYRSVRVGEYRIIYSFYSFRPEAKQIIILTVGPRGGIYR
jgi:mRNA-degrading endonuclease RelE of RelBE toxin-antitoxin system